MASRLGSILLGISLLVGTGSAWALSDPPTRLEDLLPRLARTSELFRDSALRFACTETIQWSGQDSGAGRQEFGYVYVHSGDGFADYRTWPDEIGPDSKVPPREVNPSAYDVPVFLRHAYMWVFVFGQEAQEKHRYTVVGHGFQHQRPAVRIRFESIPPIVDQVNEWYGYAWVDRETAQPLEFEAYRAADWKIKQDLDSGSAAGGTHDVERIVTVFSAQQNGMRFPGTVEIDRRRYRLRSPSRKPKQTSLLFVQQTYSDYRFYGVRTAEEILGLRCPDDRS